MGLQIGNLELDGYLPFIYQMAVTLEKQNPGKFDESQTMGQKVIERIKSATENDFHPTAVIYVEAKGSKVVVPVKGATLLEIVDDIQSARALPNRVEYIFKVFDLLGQEIELDVPLPNLNQLGSPSREKEQGISR